MTIKSVGRVIGMSCNNKKLIEYILIILRTVISESIFSVEWGCHVDTVQPHLVGINQLKPEPTFACTRLASQLGAKHLHCFPVLFIFCPLIHPEENFSSVDAIQTQFRRFVTDNVSIRCK